MKKNTILFYLLIVLCSKSNAQQHIITADNLFYIEHNVENELEMDLFFQNYKNEKAIPAANLFTIDYDKLVVKTDMQNNIKAYPITQVTKLDDRLDCVYLDANKNISYHLQYYYKHPTLNKSFLFISWENKNEDVEVSESVYVGPEAQLF